MSYERSGHMTTNEIENTDRVERIFEAFGRGDIAYILDQLADDVRFVSHLDPIVPWAGEFSGKDNVPRYFQALGASGDVTAHPVNAVVAQDETVPAPADVSFRVPETGKIGSSSWVYIFKLSHAQAQTY